MSHKLDRQRWIILIVVVLVSSVLLVVRFAAESQPITISLKRTVVTGKSSIRALAYSADDTRFAAIDKTGFLQVWDTKSWDRIQTIPEAGNGNSIAFWNTDRIAVTWGRGLYREKSSAVVIWSISTGGVIAKLPVALIANSSVVCVGESPPLLISGAAIPRGGFKIKKEEAKRYFGAIEMWSEGDIERFSTNEVTRQLGFKQELFHHRGEVSERSDSVNCLMLTRDQSVCAALGDENIGSGFAMMFDATTGGLIWRKELPDYPVKGGCYIDNFQKLCIASLPRFGDEDETVWQPKNAIRILRVEDGEELLQWSTNHNRITSVSGNDRLNVIATGGSEGGISLWRPNDGTMISGFKSELDAVTALKFSGNGEELVAGGKNGKVCVYRIRLAKVDRR